MTRDELIAAVPVHYQDGRPYFVALEEIPEPWCEQFWGALYGSQCPVVPGVERAAYAWDWNSWVTDSWYGGRNGPTGLTDGGAADHASPGTNCRNVSPVEEAFIRSLLDIERKP